MLRLLVSAVACVLAATTGAAVSRKVDPVPAGSVVATAPAAVASVPVAPTAAAPLIMRRPSFVESLSRGPSIASSYAIGLDAPPSLHPAISYVEDSLVQRDESLQSLEAQLARGLHTRRRLLIAHKLMRAIAGLRRAEGVHVALAARIAEARGRIKAATDTAVELDASVRRVEAERRREMSDLAAKMQALRETLSEEAVALARLERRQRTVRGAIRRWQGHVARLKDVHESAEFGLAAGVAGDAYRIAEPPAIDAGRLLFDGGRRRRFRRHPLARYLAAAGAGAVGGDARFFRHLAPSPATLPASFDAIASTEDTTPRPILLEVAKRALREGAGGSLQNPPKKGNSVGAGSVEPYLHEAASSNRFAAAAGSASVEMEALEEAEEDLAKAFAEERAEGGE